MQQRHMVWSPAVIILGSFLLMSPAGAQTGAAQDPPRESRYPGSAAELYEGKWSTGGGIGILANTPDDAALALMTNVEYFVNDAVSVGPLAQFAFTDDLTQVGISGQVKYWIDLEGTGGRGKANLQGGLGFVNSDIGRSDTSWLIPIGIGYDYALNSGMSLNGTVLVNFSGLDIGGDAEVMPGVMFGVRF